MSLNLAYNFFALFLFLTAFILSLFPGTTNNRAYYYPFALLASLIILFLPIREAPVFYYLRAYIGDLSITSSIFFGAYVARKGLGRALYQAAEGRHLLWTILLLGLFLYPAALGLGQFDPYRLGYHPQALLVLLLFSAVYLWFKAYYFLLFVVTSVVVAFSSGLLESNNLWDYLLDAVLWLFCIAKLLLAGLKTLPKKPGLKGIINPPDRSGD